MDKNKLHIERLKEIRPFVNFNLNINEIKKGNLSNYEKRKIKRYYDEIKELTAHPHYAYKPRSQERRKAAEKFANQKGLNGLKAVFIPVKKDGEKPNLKFKDGEMYYTDDNTEIHAAEFNKQALLKDPNKEINRAKKELKGSNYFTVMCGKHESIKHIRDKDTINELIIQWQTQYKETEKWLNGLYGYKTKNQSSFNEYMKAKKESREDFQAIRKRDKARKKSIKEIDYALKFASEEKKPQLMQRKDKLKKLLGK